MKSLLKILDGCWISRLRFSFCYCYCLLALLAAGNASPVGTSRWNSRRMRPPSCPTCCPLTSSSLLVNESRLNTGLYLKRLVLRWSCKHRNQKSAGKNVSPRSEKTCSPFLFRSYKSLMVLCSALLFLQIQWFAFIYLILKFAANILCLAHETLTYFIILLAPWRGDRIDDTITAMEFKNSLEVYVKVGRLRWKRTLDEKIICTVWIVAIIVVPIILRITRNACVFKFIFVILLRIVNELSHIFLKNWISIVCLSNEIKKRTSGVSDEFNIWQVQASCNVYPRVDFSICFVL